ncbi:hypothetical protein V6N11_081499 [Hibiscus sabdariffa]|uniref:Uncharacterized protein n=1 Tax=Hibiscus sabdariffa TaxID=183260 RepID=A0ABR1ZPM4_9ROSI
MNFRRKVEERFQWDHQNTKKHSTVAPTFPKLVVSSIFFISILCLFYTLSFSNASNSSNHQLSISKTIRVIGKEIPSPVSFPPKLNPAVKTNLRHIVFGIAASARFWEQRKKYIRLWWKPQRMRGIVWLDKPVKNGSSDEDRLLPPVRISGDTSKFKYKNPKGHRSAIRISRIVSETLRLGFEDVRWFVMGDDDTFFVPENLVRVLSKYDHNQLYYIGSSSESHLQNINFSYGMAYGGGGFAISYPLAEALAKMQDRCIQRYPGLYGSDDRIHACMAELGVPLTKEPGFHQYDVYGSLLGLLSAHPVAPLISIHHLDVVEPIFPNVNRVQALQRLKVPINLDSPALMQQSVCYDKLRSWTVERTTPASLYTRPVARHACQRPFVFYLANALYNKDTNQTASEYVQHRISRSECNWKMADPSRIDKVHVYKKPDPHLWDKAPRRNCCKVLPTKKKGTMVVDIGVCGEDEAIELR